MFVIAVYSFETVTLFIMFVIAVYSFETVTLFIMFVIAVYKFVKCKFASYVRHSCL